jgi:mono/diheme cytochrome c family protein
MNTWPPKLSFVAVTFLLTLVGGCGESTSEAASGKESDTHDHSDDSHSDHSDHSHEGEDEHGDKDERDEDRSDHCVPDKEAWRVNVSDMVDEWCGKCHGKTPKFGAPFTLLDYDALVDGEPDDRRVDNMANVLLEGQMPPKGAKQLPHEVEDTLVEWATCGQKHPDHTEDVETSAPIFDAPEQPPEGAKTFEARADGFELGANQLNHYQCFVTEVPFDEPRFIKRIEPIVDEDRVLHHALVSIDRDGGQQEDSFNCPGFPPGDGLIYGWAPGLKPIQFESGGVRMEPGSQIIVQIHYNNGAGVENVSDRSGIRIHHRADVEPVYTLAELGPLRFSIPPGETKSASSTCRVQQETDILASFPHMHEIGKSFKSTIIRKDGSEETLIELNNWNFEAQLFYETPKTVEPGDKIKTRCTWRNTREHPVRFGPRTEDEMCFNFAYVTPPNLDFCKR